MSPPMHFARAQPHILTDLSITLPLHELTSRLQTGANNPAILATAKQTLARVQNIWKPVIVYNWFPFTLDEQAEEGSILRETGGPVVFQLGHSSAFLKGTEYALTAVYSAGTELEMESRKAMESKEMLGAFILDQIGLLVLEKTGDFVKRIAQEQAAELGWGVSPFLSPGSVHGWELEEQKRLCTLLPLESIGLQVRDDAVLMPFKSLSCLIGIGPGRTAPHVGTTCQVCSRKQNCQMKQQ